MSVGLSWHLTYIDGNDAGMEGNSSLRYQIYDCTHPSSEPVFDQVKNYPAKSGISTYGTSGSATTPTQFFAKAGDTYKARVIGAVNYRDSVANWIFTFRPPSIPASIGPPLG